MAKSNLALLTEAVDGLSLDQVNRFDAYVLGALSIHTTPERWQSILDAAKAHFAMEDSPCPATGVGGIHSDAFLEGEGRCEWCGALPR